MRLIDADKLKECDFVEYGYEMRYEIDRQPTVKAIPIPEGATNGDMIKAMFPDYTTYEFAIEDSLKIATMFVIPEKSQVFYVNFDLDWWNAPYKRESEDKK